MKLKNLLLAGLLLSWGSAYAFNECKYKLRSEQSSNEIQDVSSSYLELAKKLLADKGYLYSENDAKYVVKLSMPRHREYSEVEVLNAKGSVLVQAIGTTEFIRGSKQKQLIRAIENLPSCDEMVQTRIKDFSVYSKFKMDFYLEPSIFSQYLSHAESAELVFVCGEYLITKIPIIDFHSHAKSDETFRLTSEDCNLELRISGQFYNNLNLASFSIDTRAAKTNLYNLHSKENMCEFDKESSTLSCSKSGIEFLKFSMDELLVPEEG